MQKHLPLYPLKCPPLQMHILHMWDAHLHTACGAQSLLSPLCGAQDLCHQIEENLSQPIPCN